MRSDLRAPLTAYLVLLLLTGLPVPLHSQVPADTTAVESRWVGPQVGPFVGLHWDRLQLVTFSGGAGTLWCRDPDPAGRPFCAGSFVLVSPGWRGGELTIGALAISTTRLAAVAPGVSVLRTWNEPAHAANHATYVGPRLRLVVIPVGVALGWYWRIAGPSGTHDAVWTVSVGVGLP